MLNKKVFQELTTTPDTVITINDMTYLKSHADPIINGRIHVKVFFDSGYKYSSAVLNSYEVNTETLDCMIESIREAIEAYSTNIKDNMLLNFNKSR